MAIFKGSLHVVLVVALLVAHSSGALSNFQKTQCKKWHNYYRLMHQVQRVTYTTDLEKKATRWANYLAKNNKFQHETSSPGNLYMTSIQESNPCRVAVTAFYSEEKKYNYKKPGWSTATGHFTQLVWKSTRNIGAAWVQRKDKKWVLVIKYSPAGNNGQYAKNVFPPRATVKPPITTVSNKRTDGVTTNVTTGNTTLSHTTMSLGNTTIVLGNTTIVRAKALRVISSLLHLAACFIVGVLIIIDGE